MLTGSEIKRQVDLGRITISPFVDAQVNPNSYDFRLGDTLKIYRNTILDPKIAQETFEIPMSKEGHILSTDKIFLGFTYEVMGSDFYVPIISAKSSIEKMGLFIHITANLIDIGSHNQWTLQLFTAKQPIRVYPMMLIGQVTFWPVEGVIELYKGKYQHSRGPQPSQIYKDFIHR